jgi:hypothetical protein
MICPKCEGKGWYDNPNYPAPANHSWAGIPTIDCRKCKRTGYIIGDVKDVVDFLKHLEVKFKDNKELLGQVKQCINAIEK